MNQKFSTRLQITSELFINLSAAWFSAAFIVPALQGFEQKLNLLPLLLNVVFGMVFLELSLRMRRIV